MSKFSPSSIALLAPIGFGLALSACNSFDPNLGQAPFRCGTDSPRCPDGYTCVSYSATEEICEKNADGSDRPDGAPADARPLVCNDDALEPNNATASPTNTQIPSTQTSVRLVGLAICPATDNDFFRFDVPNAGTNAIAQLEYESSRGTLSLDVLNGSGNLIGSAGPVNNDPDIIRVAIPNLSQGTYYVQVRSTEGAQNNYDIEIVTN